MYSVSKQAAIAADFAMVGFTFLLVLLRLYVRVRIIHRFDVTDALVCIAWCTFVWTCTSDILADNYGLWDPRIEYSRSGKLPDFEKFITDRDTLRRGLILAFLGPPFPLIVIYAIKMSFILWYWQVFPSDMRKLIMALKVSFVLIVLIFTSVLLMDIFMCWPISRNWTFNKAERCMTIANVPRFFYVTFTSIFTDLLVYGLPFFLLPTLYRSRSTSRRKLIAIAALMSLGVLPILCAVGKLIANADGTTATTYAVWGSAEQAGAIAVGCCPPLRYLFSRKGGPQSQSNGKETGGADGAQEETTRPQTRTAWRFWRIGGLTAARDVESTVDTYAVGRTVNVSIPGKGAGGVIRVAAISRDDERSFVGGGLAPVPRRHSSAVGPLEGVVVAQEAAAEVHGTEPARGEKSEGTFIPAEGLWVKVKKKMHPDEKEPSSAQSRRGSRRNRRGSNTFGGTQQSTYNAKDAHERPSFSSNRARDEPSQVSGRNAEVNDRGFLNTMGGTANASRPASSVMEISPG